MIITVYEIPLDLPEDTKLNIEINSPIFSGDSSMSLPISIPLTNKNRRTLDLPDDLTKYDYEVVNKYSYSNGVDSSKTNEQTTHACITNATGSNLYSTQYNSSKAKAWSKVNSLYGQYFH